MQPWTSDIFTKCQLSQWQDADRENTENWGQSVPGTKSTTKTPLPTFAYNGQSLIISRFRWMEHGWDVDGYGDGLPSSKAAVQNIVTKVN